MKLEDFVGKTIKDIKPTGEQDWLGDREMVLIHFTDGTKLLLWGTYDWSRNETYVRMDLDGG